MILNLTMKWNNRVPKMPTEPMWTAESGAKRGEVKPRYDLIPTGPIRRLAKRYTDGAIRYGEWNWQKGLADPEYIKQFKAHVMDHWLDYLDSGCEQDDNLAAMAWGIFALMEVERVAAEGNRPRGNAGDEPARPIDEGPLTRRPDSRSGDVGGDSRGSGRGALTEALKRKTIEAYDASLRADPGMRRRRDVGTKSGRRKGKR